MDLSPLFENDLLTLIWGARFSPSSLAIDSRKVEKGALFLAIPGTTYDGALFIEDALKRGAEGIVVSSGLGKKIASDFKDDYPTVSFFETPHVRKAASLLAAHFYPLQPETVVAVTGTNGKTSVVSFMRQLWYHLGQSAASLGTLGLVIEGRPLPSPTGTEGTNTPPAVLLHQILQTLQKEGIETLAFEASSHALSQHRLDSVQLKAGVFTTFSNDHLDYHKTMDAYFQAKTRLFSEVLEPGCPAILNAELPFYEQLLKICKDRDLPIISFGQKGTHVRLLSLSPTEEGQEIEIECLGKRKTLYVPLIGKFQIDNIMAALGAVVACGADPAQALEVCAHLKGVPGRLERVIPRVYVDYSHTPEGLLVALQALRPHTKGNLSVVFGCGGDRDAVKRPLMGEIAAHYADRIIITDDNPRHEDPALIRHQILEACPRARESTCRREAIQWAVTEMGPEDLVLIAGKGHEPYQIVKDQILPFDDGEEVKKWAPL